MFSSKSYIEAAKYKKNLEHGINKRGRISVNGAICDFVKVLNEVASPMSRILKKSLHAPAGD